MGQRLKRPQRHGSVRPDASNHDARSTHVHRTTSHRPRSCSARPPAGSARPTPACTPTSGPASRSCSPAGARSWPTTWASGRPARRSSPPARPRRTGPYLVICPAGVKLNWRREIRPGRARRRRPGGRTGKDAFDPTAPLDGRQLRPARPLRGRLAAVAWGGVDRRRGALHQERVEPRGAGAAAARRRPDGRRDPAGRLPADRHADDEPAARPVQPAARRSATRSATQLLQLRQALLRRRTTTASGWTRAAPRTSRSSPRSSPA